MAPACGLECRYMDFSHTETLAGGNGQYPNVADTYVASLAALASCSRSFRALEAFFSFLLRSRSSFSIAARWSSCARRGRRDF